MLRVFIFDFHILWCNFTVIWIFVWIKRRQQSLCMRKNFGIFCVCRKVLNIPLDTPNLPLRTCKMSIYMFACIQVIQVIRVCGNNGDILLENTYIRNEVSRWKASMWIRLFSSLLPSDCVIYDSLYDFYNNHFSPVIIEFGLDFDFSAIPHQKSDLDLDLVSSSHTAICITA